MKHIQYDFWSSSIEGAEKKQIQHSDKYNVKISLLVSVFQAVLL